jgi:hypothetical protein
MKAIALGADGVVIGTAEMVALGCVRCACCESGRGCPRGIASTDPELMMQMSLEWATQRLINLMSVPGASRWSTFWCASGLPASSANFAAAVTCFALPGRRTGVPMNERFC